MLGGSVQGSAEKDDVMTRIYRSQQECPVARTLNIVGDRWTVLVLRDLAEGRHRFNDLLSSLEGISPNLLADRLKRLEEHGMVERVFYTQHPPRAEYHLTPKGRRFRGGAGGDVRVGEEARGGGDGLAAGRVVGRRMQGKKKAARWAASFVSG